MGSSGRLRLPGSLPEPETAREAAPESCHSARHTPKPQPHANLEQPTRHGFSYRNQCSAEISRPKISPASSDGLRSDTLYGDAENTPAPRSPCANGKEQCQAFASRLS